MCIYDSLTACCLSWDLAHIIRQVVLHLLCGMLSYIIGSTLLSDLLLLLFFNIVWLQSPTFPSLLYFFISLFPTFSQYSLNFFVFSFFKFSFFQYVISVSDNLQPCFTANIKQLSLSDVQVLCASVVVHVYIDFYERPMYVPSVKPWNTNVKPIWSLRGTLHGDSIFLSDGSNFTLSISSVALPKAAK